MKLKYIILQTAEGKQLPFVFSEELVHDDFLKGVIATPIGYYVTSGKGWERSLRTSECVAAGFYYGTHCDGQSESIGVQSRGAIDFDIINGTTKSSSDYIAPACIESIQTAIAFTPHDWSAHHRLAWVYAIVMGYEDALSEVAKEHQWDAKTVERLKSLREEFTKLRIGK